MTMPANSLGVAAPGSSYEQTESRFARMSVRSSSPYAHDPPRSGSVGRRKDAKHVVMQHTTPPARDEDLYEMVGGVEVKRTFHNERERLRRSTIRNLFEELRLQVPVLVAAEGTSDRQILVEAATHIDGLNAQGQQYERELTQLRLQNIRLRLARCQAPPGSEERLMLEGRMATLEAALRSGAPCPTFAASPVPTIPFDSTPGSAGRRRRSPAAPSLVRPSIGLPSPRGRNGEFRTLGILCTPLSQSATFCQPASCSQH